MLSVVFIFNGCSTKTQVPQASNSINVIASASNGDDIEDEFLDEFEQEFQAQEVYGPLESYNRVMTNFNDKLYIYVLKPLSNGYKSVTTKGVRDSVGNFFHNLLYPIRLVNNMLQGKFSNSAEETGRFIINSTIGLLGLFDVAKSQFGLEAHNEDFGQTLGYWGVGSGPHIVLPFFGPSNLRDAFSLYPNSLLNPIDYHQNREYNLASNSIESLAIRSFEKVNSVAQSNNAYELMKKDAIDLYPYLRDVYEQHREKLIKDEN